MPYLAASSDATALNQVQWRGRRQRGHYEVWYVTLRDPKSQESFWLRYTLHLPPDASQPGEAALWAFSFAPDGSGLELRDVYHCDRFRDRSTPQVFQLNLASATLGGAGARGEVGSGERRIAWDLDFEWARGSFQHMPALLFRAGLAGSCVSTPNQLIGVRGAIEVGERRVELRDARGEQGHVYGRRHADEWVWTQCNTFQGDVDAVFEGVSARVKKTGLTVQGTPLQLRVGGRELSFNGLRSIWSPQSELELGRWRFEARRGNELLRGELRADPGSFVAVEYADPDGRRAWCNHSEHGELAVELCERRRGQWEPAESLRAERVPFEYGSRERLAGPRRALELAQARRVD